MLVRPIAGLSSPFVVALLAAAVSASIALRSEFVALVFIPVMALAFLVIALAASVLVNLAEVPVVIGVDGLSLGGKRFVAFADLTALAVDRDRLTLVSRGRTETLCARAGAHGQGASALRAAWETFRDGQREARELETRFLIETVDGGYRAGTVSDDELAAAITAPALSPRLRIEAARTLLRLDPARAALVADEAASSTADGVLESELRKLTSPPV